MTFSSRLGPDPTDMFRRLRARPASSWAHGGREPAMRAALQQLADLAADASGRSRRVVPDVGVGAQVDQLAVLFADAGTAGVPGETADGLLTGLAGQLGVRLGGQ